MKIEITIKGVIYTLITGIVACAVWEICRPLFGCFFNFILSLTETISSAYSDSIYREISLGFHESSSVTLLGSFLLLLALFSVFLYKKLFFSSRKKLKAINDPHPAEQINEDDSNFEEKQNIIKKHRKILVLFLLCIFLFLMSIYKVGEIYFINHAQTITLANIEIVSPYISDAEYKQLKADFHSIDSKSDYHSVSDTLSSIAKANNLELK